MHVAIVIHDFALGGAERIALRLAGAWHAAGERVTIVSGAAEGELRALVDPGIAVIAPERQIARGFTRRGLARYATRVLPPLAPDIVLLPGNYYFGLAAPLRRCLPHARIVGKVSNAMHRHGEPRLKAMARRALLRRKARYLDVMALFDPATLAATRAVIGGAAERYVVVGHPVLDRLPERTAHERKNHSLMAAGRLVEQKDMALAIAALGHLPEAFRLTIYGIGPLEGELRAQAEASGVAERVAFAGFVPRLDDAYRGHGLFLLTSRYEGYPSVAIEALAHGLPVVATDCAPALAVLLDRPDVGALIASRRPEDVAAAVLAQSARGARDDAAFAAATRDFTLPAVADRFLALFRALGAGPSAGAR